MRKASVLGILFLGATFLMGHPHLPKTVKVELSEEVEASIAYRTVPANKAHAENAEVGSFVTPRSPSLTLSGEIKAGSVTVPAGEYTIGAIKDGPGNWTMALYPGRLARRESPDMSKLIRLDSLFSDSRGVAEHLLIDIVPGHGKFEGKAVLTLRFGTLSLDGALG